MPFRRLDLSGLPRDAVPDEVADRFHQRNFHRATPNVIATRRCYELKEKKTDKPIPIYATLSIKLHLSTERLELYIKSDRSYVKGIDGPERAQR